MAYVSSPLKLSFIPFLLSFDLVLSFTGVSGVYPDTGIEIATHGTAPSYLSQLVRVADLPGRRSLRSARTSRLLVPSVQLPTVGGRAFPVAGPTIWNSLPDNVISVTSLSTFRQLFQA